LDTRVLHFSEWEPPQSLNEGQGENKQWQAMVESNKYQ
jgi:hypothetical protein